MTQPTQAEALGLDRNPPAAKFEDPKDTVTGVVLSATPRIAMKFGTGQADTWPGGRPKFEFVIVLDDGSEDGTTVYARNLMLKAISDAVVAADSTEITPGAELTVTYTGDGPGKPGLNPAKLYTATYKPQS